MTIQGIRQQYPQYNDMPDSQLADSLHQKFYSDMPKKEFYQKIGLTQTTQAPIAQTAMDKLNTSGDITKHFKRIPQVYQEQVDSGLRNMQQGNILEKILGGLQYVSAPLNAPIQAMVGEPVQSISEQVGVPRSIAQPLGMAAEVGIGFAPTKATSLLGKVAEASGIGQNYNAASKVSPSQIQRILDEFVQGGVPKADRLALPPGQGFQMVGKPVTKLEGKLFNKGKFAQSAVPDIKPAPEQQLIGMDVPVTIPKKVSQMPENINIAKQDLPDNIPFIDEKIQVALGTKPFARTAEQKALLQGQNIDFLGMQTLYDKIFDKPELTGFITPKGEMRKSIRHGLDEVAGIVSTRLGNISEELRSRMRRYVFDEGLSTSKDLEAIEPFYTKFRNLDEPTQLQITEMLSNGQIKESEAMFSKLKMLSEFRQAEKTKNALWQRAKASGLEAGEIQNHWPRKVQNYEELIKTLGGEDRTLIDKSIREIELKRKMPLTIEEKGMIANSVLRGYNPAQINLSRPGFAKQRKIGTLTPELTPYYSPAHESLKDYVESLNRNIAQNKLFGKGEDKTLARMGLKLDDTNTSIGELIEQLKARGQVFTPTEEQDIRNIIGAVVKPKMTGKGTQAAKDIIYTSTLTNVGPALTQVQDLALAFEKEGFFNSLKGMAKSVAGKQDVTIKDLGIDRIAEEMKGSSGPVDWLLKNGLKWSGFNAIDRLGKETVINGAFAKYKAMANKNPEKLGKILEPLFMDDTVKVIGDLKTGKITDDVKFLLFNELSDIQPISKMEVPEKYLTGGGSKVFYALKTYQLKLWDIYRREIFQEIKKGNVKEGLGKLGRLTTGLVVLGAGTDQVKDWVFGRETDFSDTVVDNFLKLGGLSKYTTWTARREGIWPAITKTIAPAGGMLTDIGKDVQTLYNQNFEPDTEKWINAHEKGSEVMKNIPIIGKPYYWHFGEGARKESNKRLKEENNQ